MNIALYGPGRAGGSLLIAASNAGHPIVHIGGRSSAAVASLKRRVPVTVGEPDVLIIAVSDDALPRIEATSLIKAPIVMHLSGAVSIAVLEPFAAAGARIASFHPLQTLPDWEAGARRLPGSSVAVTAELDTESILADFARSLGCRPFAITDEAKPLYHAAASAAANHTIAALAVADALFRCAGVDPLEARPLVESVIDNAYDMGPVRALTGPIARGDISTVAAQLDAIRAEAPELTDAFVSLCSATASVAGRTSEFAEVLR
ncbi:MAG: DUF2520 domain-containing protein [Acidimicrobiia bacterium]